MTRKTWARLTLPVALAVIALIIALQNTSPVETRLLFATVTMPAALLLLCTLVLGVIVGIIGALLVIKGERQPTV